MPSFFHALMYPFEQKGWFKELLLAIGIAAIPLIGYFMIKGWEFEISTRVRHKAPRLMPGWGNPGNRLVRGVLIRIAGFFYNIPVYILIGITIWLWLGPIIRVVQGQVPVDIPVTQLYEPALGLRIGMIPVTLIAGFLFNSFYWSGYLRYIETRRYIMFFDFGTNVVIMITTMYDDFIMGIYLFLAQSLAGILDTALSAGLAATGVGAFLIPIVVPAVNFTFMSSVSAYLFGKMTENTFGEGEEPIVPPRRRMPPPEPRRSRSYRPPR